MLHGEKVRNEVLVMKFIPAKYRHSCAVDHSIWQRARDPTGLAREPHRPWIFHHHGRGGEQEDVRDFEGQDDGSGR